MAKKIKEIVVKTGEYQDRNTGETKARWQNVGSLMQNDDDNSLFVILDRTFNPAGVPNSENRSNVILSCFDLKDKNEGQQNNGQSQQGNGYQGGGQSQGGQGYGGGNMDDEIKF